MSGGGVRADTTLLGRLRELQAAYAAEVEAEAVHGGMIPVTATRHALITAAVGALPVVVALVEAAQGVEAVIRKCAVENIEVDADALGAWSILLRGPLAPFQKGTE